MYKEIIKKHADQVNKNSASFVISDKTGELIMVKGCCVPYRSPLIDKNYKWNGAIPSECKNNKKHNGESAT